MKFDLLTLVKEKCPQNEQFRYTTKCVESELQLTIGSTLLFLVESSSILSFVKVLSFCKKGDEKQKYKRLQTWNRNEKRN
jgi:hypothetical protein